MDDRSKLWNNYYYAKAGAITKWISQIESFELRGKLGPRSTLRMRRSPHPHPHPNSKSNHNLPISLLTLIEIKQQNTQKSEQKPKPTQSQSQTQSVSHKEIYLRSSSFHSMTFGGPYSNNSKQIQASTRWHSKRQLEQIFVYIWVHLTMSCNKDPKPNTEHRKPKTQKPKPGKMLTPQTVVNTRTLEMEIWNSFNKTNFNCCTFRRPRPGGSL